MAGIERPAARPSLAEHIRATLAFVGVGRLVASAGSIVLVAVGGWWLLRTPTPPVERSLPFAVGSSTTAAATTVAPPATSQVAAGSPATIVVQAAGSVVSPGVYTLPAGSRVNELISAAGGPAPGADTEALQLAAVLADGQRVYVPVAGEIPPGAALAGPAAPAGGGGGGASPGPLDLNRASAQELDALPGIGPATAAAIVAYREANGPFASVDDLLEVRGIGPAKLGALSGLVTV